MLRVIRILQIRDELVNLRLSFLSIVCCDEGFAPNNKLLVACVEETLDGLVIVLLLEESQTLQEPLFL